MLGRRGKVGSWTFIAELPCILTMLSRVKLGLPEGRFLYSPPQATVLL